MTISSNGWSSNSDHDFSQSPQTTDDFEFNQRGKPAKAIVGLGILVGFGLALTFFHPASHDVSTSSPILTDSAHSNNASSASGGKSPSTWAK